MTRSNTEKDRIISMFKQGHTYVFRYDNRYDLIKKLASMAADKEVDFDWYDAAVVSYKAGFEA